MSFNRGVKRNSFGNNRSNFNRGSGGGNMPTGGNAMGGAGGGAGSRGVNPWESGVMPGRGILPTPNNNLSLNSPQAQLVIASNLLSNLLRTQQDNQPQLPSLMSINNSANGPNSSFRGQQNFGGQGRFNDRPLRGNVKNQRAQPYNKMGNRARDGIAGRRGPSSAQQSRAQSQSGNQRQNGNQNQHRNDKNSKANAGSKQNQTKKQEQQDVKNSDNEKPDTETVVKSDEKAAETAEGDAESKDKEAGEAMETSQTEEKTGEEEKKEGDKTASPEKKNEDGQSGKKSEARHAESRYSAVPISHMVCHVCNKRMWDGFSFENHLRGRAHQLMMEKLDESYKLKVDLMRHELRVAEEQREMSLNNSKRRGKKVSVDLNVREYCTMCDLNFYGTLSSHRKSDKHQQLKTFLHPRCFPCVKEFPSRIEYDEHCLTPQHMLNAIQNEEQKKSKKNKLAKGESEVRTGEDEEKDVGSDSKTADKEEELPENIEYLTDIVEDMDMTKYKVPSYKYCRTKQIGLGASLVKEVQGFHCEKCRRFMATQEDMAAHLKTLTHYRSFVNEVKALTAPPPAAEVVKTEEAPKTEETVAEDEENPAKRPKLDEEAKEEEKTEEQPAETKEEEDKPKEDGNDKYDPLEADAESEEEAKEVKEGEATENNEEKAAEAWEEMDNENESEVGNLIDGDEKQEAPPTPTKQPQNSAPTTPVAPEPPIISKTPSQTPQNQTTSTPSSNQTTPNQNSNQTPNHSPMNTPGKTPGRGRGFRGGGGGGGRGGQRARRSRR